MDIKASFDTADAANDPTQQQSIIDYPQKSAKNSNIQTLELLNMKRDQGKARNFYTYD